MTDGKATTLMLIGQAVGMEQVVAAALQSANESRAFPTVQAALNSGFSAEITLVLQHWSDEFMPDEIQKLLEASPLSRFIVVQGPWCASDRRTRQFWPAAVCVPIERGLARLAQELEVLAGKRLPLPWTAALDEIFAFDQSGG
ncbi:hypothetical protein SH661x_003421 [Planctomicrobium sp. SH661]|uniref:hypothetical protein n=1 Tax=Planctomicrobium sp. SH661 TaxID=3448124 RepID=UPI003F5C30CD